MQNPSARNASDRNLVLAVMFILIISCVCSLYTTYVIQTTLDALGSSHTMALLIVDGGKSFASDDVGLERNINSAISTLRISIDVAKALVACCIIISLGLCIRQYKASNRLKNDLR